MKRKSKNNPKATVGSVTADLRYQGYQPLYQKGRLVDWRRIRKGTLEMVDVTVHASGRVSTNYRSSQNGSKAERKRDSVKVDTHSGRKETDTSTA